MWFPLLLNYFVFLSKSFFILIFFISFPVFFLPPCLFLHYVFPSYASSAPCVSTLGLRVSWAAAPTHFSPLCLHHLWTVIWILRHPRFLCSLVLSLPLVFLFMAWEKPVFCFANFTVSLNSTSFQSFTGLFRKQVVKAVIGACIWQVDSALFFSLWFLSYQCYEVY